MVRKGTNQDLKGFSIKGDTAIVYVTPKMEREVEMNAIKTLQTHSYLYVGSETIN